MIDLTALVLPSPPMTMSLGFVTATVARLESAGKMAHDSHGRLMDLAFNKPPIPDFDTIPVLYQGASDDFLGPCADATFVSEADGIDLEGEFGVIVDEVPMGPSTQGSADRIRLVVQINDWSLRVIGAYQMPRGFGFLQAKPSTSFAPVAVTPDELGPAWRDACASLRTTAHISMRYGATPRHRTAAGRP